MYSHHPDRTQPPHPVDLTQLSMEGNAFGLDHIRAETHFLSNGIPVHWVKMGQTEILKIEFVFRAGFKYQPRNLVANFTNHLLKDGTTKRTSYEIAHALDHYGASLSHDVDKDRAGITFYTQSKHLWNLLPIVCDILLNPVFPEEECAILLSNKRQQYLVDLQRVAYLAGKRFQQTLYGPDHPYGKSLAPEDFNTLVRQDMVDFHAGRYRMSDCMILVSGPDTSALLPLLETELGSVQHPPAPADPVLPAFPETFPEETLFEEKANALQNAIRIGKRSMPITHHDFTALKVANTLLGGFFGSRLMRNIREEKGYTYGIGSALISYEDSGAFLIHTEVAEEVTTAAMEEIIHEVQHLALEPASEQEMKLVKNYLLGSFLRSIDGTFEVASRVKEMLIHNLPEDYYHRYINEIQQISAERLQEVVSMYLNPSGMIKVVAGKM